MRLDFGFNLFDFELCNEPEEKWKYIRISFVNFGYRSLFEFEIEATKPLVIIKVSFLFLVFHKVFGLKK